MASLNRRILCSTKTFVLTIALGVITFSGGLSTAGWSQGFDGGKRDINVATINLYVGGDVNPLLSLNPEDPDYVTKLLNAVATIYGHVVFSNFPARADALAQQIVERGPDLVALQEVSLIRRQSPGDLLLGGHVPATDVEIDYLAVLLDALQRHGGHYAVASQVQDSDFEVPLLTSPVTADDIRLTDRDVILVRTDLPPGHLLLSNPLSANFDARLPLSAEMAVLRGWCSVDVFVRGRFFRFIDTHLEEQLPAPLPNLQAAQALELLMGPANTPLPTVLAGDFNADAYGNYSPVTYPLLIAQGGFSDTWTAAGSGLGLTWGHDELLSNPSLAFVFRLDLVLFRGGVFEATDADVVDPVIGMSPPLWFSDHGGYFARLLIH
jgi:endonuclease/exonuclease/phosphatase family metal-dependent hydrolase